MGPPSYMRSVVDRNVVMRGIPAYVALCFKLLLVLVHTLLARHTPHAARDLETRKRHRRVGKFNVGGEGGRDLSKERRNIKEKWIIRMATCCVRLLPDQDPFVLSPALLTFQIAYQEHKSAVKLTKADNRTPRWTILRWTQPSAVNNDLLRLTQ